MDAKFEQFMRERKYLKSVSQSTLGWYRQTFTRLQIPNPTQSDLTEFVVKMRECPVWLPPLSTIVSTPLMPTFDGWAPR
jgi:hypothetical protein